MGSADEAGHLHLSNSRRDGASSAGGEKYTMNVLMYPSDHGPNPYLDIVATELRRNGLTVLRWEDPQPERIDLIYLHWLENRWVTKPGGPRSLAAQVRRRRQELTRLRGYRRAGAAVVWTAHNERPHRWSGTDQRWRRRSRGLMRQVDAVIHLTEASRRSPAFEMLGDRPSAVIRHPVYPPTISAQAQAVRAGPVRRVAMIGSITPRKGYPATLQSVLAVDHLTAVVAGKPATTEVSGQLAELVARSAGRIDLIGRWVSDEEIDELFDGHTAALINTPRSLNSGVLFRALSRGAPVVCPSTPTNREAAERFGPDWVRIFDPPLGPDALRQLMAADVPKRLPSWDEHEPAHIGSELARFFRSLEGAPT
ncbi:MAG: hypothetical protein JJT89_01120 [Nitriliruptoraceae bacterium]|nr:hypothetical protein [Nitriliruptoraceae bacterium]